MTRCPSTADVAPERSTSAWSMWLAPATMACTKVSTLRPGDAPPIRPERWTVALTRRSSPRRHDHRRDQEQAGIGHQIGLVEGHANPVDPARYWRHRKCLLVLVRTAT